MHGSIRSFRGFTAALWLWFIHVFREVFFPIHLEHYDKNNYQQNYSDDGANQKGHAFAFYTKDVFNDVQRQAATVRYYEIGEEFAQYRWNKRSKKAVTHNAQRNEKQVIRQRRESKNKDGY
jgi:hypothetical protein